MSPLLIGAGLIAFLLGLVLLQGLPANAQGGDPAPAAAKPPMHPVFKLLDVNGANVRDSGQPISTMRTCGQCHDTQFIAGHSFHVDVGLSGYGKVDADSLHRAWDNSTGYFGRWDPVTYRYLSPEGDIRLDLTTVDWLKTLGIRHVGGGPAQTGRDGKPLAESGAAVDTQTVDASGNATAWDWQKSGTVEMNCFLCHLTKPDNAARIAALQAGQFGWADTATLLATNIVTKAEQGYTYNAAAFAADGLLLPEYVSVSDPRSENCGQCHGAVYTDAQVPVGLPALSQSDWTTLTTGQIISPQRLSSSGLNLAGKSTLERSFDIHAERVLNCTNCHYSLNNPVYYQETSADKPEHLTFDPRRLDLGEYLYRPLHQFAKGQGGAAPELNNTLRRCESCHSAETTHNWLPYKDRHTAALSCESCHIPRLYGPALEAVDWTVIRTDSTPRTVYRGIEGGKLDEKALITGYQPVLLPRQNADGSKSLAPYNLVTAWYWVYGDTSATRPVPLRDLQAVYLDGTNYRADVLAAFDADKNGTLDDAELFIDSADKQAIISKALEGRGLSNPRIVADTQRYGIHHDVTTAGWTTEECRTCHADDSRVKQAIVLTDRVPGGVQPTLLSDGSVALDGSIQTDSTGALKFTANLNTPGSNIYVFGHDAVDWIDSLGILIFFAASLGVIGHGGLRFMAARRQARAHPELKRVYMYGVYERLWHWLQTAVILGLLMTGVIVHSPDRFTLFSFSFIVQVHNILALILVVNAGLSLFYHLASGEIRQFLPKPRGFINDAIEQAKYYLSGIFRGKAHPFEKRPDRKMNPLQQFTYLAILNVLLPAQIITGALMWGAQHIPQVAQALGGLSLLAPVHTAVAWLFATFIVGHVYLTTTGPRPLTAIKAMMMGWEDVEPGHAEGHPPSAEGAQPQAATD